MNEEVSSVLTITALYTNQLTDVQLLGLATAINLDMDITQVDGYDKVKELFKNGVHDLTKAAINKLAQARVE